MMAGIGCHGKTVDYLGHVRAELGFAEVEKPGDLAFGGQAEARAFRGEHDRNTPKT